MYLGIWCQSTPMSQATSASQPSSGRLGASSDSRNTSGRAAPEQTMEDRAHSRARLFT